tara:strand:- start:348 stop:521 length:174 start_codon:yes stop_codon:yes gene_type:complete
LGLPCSDLEIDRKTGVEHTPRYVLKDGTCGKRTREAPFENHTDAELTMIESLVGHVP